MEGFLPPVVVELVANIKQFQAKMGEARGELVALETQGASSFAKFQKFSLIAGAGAAAAIVGGVALAVKAYQEDEQAQARLQQALTNTHQSYAALEPQLKATAQSMAKFGFEDNQATDALATLVTATGSAEKSQKLLSVAADLAAYKHIDLSQAATLVAKASNGSATALSRMGINIGDLGDKGKTAAEKLEYGNKVIAKLTAQIGGQANAQAKTFAGTMAALSATMGNFASDIGEVVMPYVQILADGLKNVADWITANEAVVKIFIGVIAGVLVVVIANATVILLAYAAAWVAANLQIIAVIAAIGLVVAAFKSHNPLIVAAAAAVVILTAAIYGQRIALAAVSVAKTVYIAALYASSVAAGVASAADTIYIASLYAMDAALGVAAAGVEAFMIAIDLATGPVGWIIGALTLMGIAAYKLGQNYETTAKPISTINGKIVEFQQGTQNAHASVAILTQNLKAQASAAAGSAKETYSAADAYDHASNSAANLAKIEAELAAPFKAHVAYQIRIRSSVVGSEQLYAGYGRVAEATKKWKEEQKKLHEHLNTGSGAATSQKEKVVALDKAMSGLISTTKRWAAGAGSLTQSLGGDLVAKFTASVQKAGTVTQATADAFVAMGDQIKSRIADTITAATKELDAAKQKFDEYRNSISSGISSGNELADAAKAQSDAIQAVADALENQVKAQAALDAAKKNTGEDTAGKIAEAQKAYDEATTSLANAKDKQQGFLGFLQVGADTAEAFGKQIESLRLHTDSLELVQRVTQLGAQTGGRIVSELISGGQQAIDKAASLVKKVRDVSADAGIAAAQQFYGAGVTAAEAFVTAVKETIPTLQSVLNDIAEMINKAGFKVASPQLSPDVSNAVSSSAPPSFPNANRDMFAEILQSGYASVMGVTLPARAAGGPVTSGQPYLVGEKGPEMFVPGKSGSIVPNGAGNTINVYAQTNANAMDIAREMAWQLKVGVS